VASLTDRSVLIAGAGGGLGPAVASAFLESGARVAGTALDQREEDRLLAALPDAGDRLSVRQLDVKDDDALGAYFDEVAGLNGGLHAVVCLIGGYLEGPLPDLSPHAIREQIELHTLCPLLCARAGARHLQASGGGSFVAVSSRAARMPWSGVAAYASAKGAVLTMVEALAAEWKRTGARANCVIPSIIDTPGNRAAMPDADPTRWVAPSAIAGVIRWLCSDEAAIVSGAAVPVYGDA
jgi:NAD(P)-dependent dehydrogenase (short-subunit alcohol dehydrogenase family)